MKSLINPNQIYLYREPVDFRKSINGLSAIVIEACELDCMTGALFLFCNKGKDKIKILYWDTTGFALWYKRLEKDQFRWPKMSSDKTLSLSKEHFDQLLDGYTIEGHQPIDCLSFAL